MFLVGIAFSCVPIMLFAKPIYIICQQKDEHVQVNVYNF